MGHCVTEAGGEPSAAGWKVSGRRWVTGRGLRRLLDDLARSPDCLSTHYLPPASSARAEYVEAGGGLSEAIGLIGETETGAAVFMGERQSVAVLPPFPMEVVGAFEGCSTTLLTEAVEKDRLIGVLLVRLGRYAVGVVNRDGLVVSKTDTRYVKNRHRAGGTSQRRFERSRERLIRELFDKVCAVAEDVLGPYGDRMDYLFLGGERQTLQGFAKRCPFLRALAPITMRRVLEVRRPGSSALRHVEEEVWKSRVLVLERT